MRNKRITLLEAKEFHGHLGPYLVLGVLAGEFILRKLRCKKYFGLAVEVEGANKKPQSCFLDGLQLSTGATFGKGNLRKLNGPLIKLVARNRINHKKVTLKFQDRLTRKLKAIKSSRDSELLARQLYKTSHFKLFNLT